MQGLRVPSAESLVLMKIEKEDQEQTLLVKKVKSEITLKDVQKVLNFKDRTLQEKDSDRTSRGNLPEGSGPPFLTR